MNADNTRDSEKVRKAIESAKKTRSKPNDSVEYNNNKRISLNRRNLAKEEEQEKGSNRKLSNGPNDQYELVYSSVFDPKLLALKPNYDNFTSMKANQKILHSSEKAKKKPSSTALEKNRYRRSKINTKLDLITANYAKFKKLGKEQINRKNKAIHLDATESKKVSYFSHSHKIA
jgi:hypothetical protein